MRRPARDAPAPGDAAHVDDVRLPLALDDVDAVEVDAERLPAAHYDLAQFCRGCERLAVLLRVGPGRENFLDAEHPATDHVHLPVAALGRVVALGEDGILSGRHGRELGDAPDDANAKAIGPLIRLDNERSPVPERLEPLGAGSDLRVLRWQPR